MNNIEHHIETLLDDHLAEYKSRHGVQYYLNTDRSLFVIAPSGEHCTNTIDIGICFQTNGISSMINILSIATMDDFHTVSYQSLWRLYRRGLADIYCCINSHGDFPLRFRKRGPTVDVLDDNDRLVERIPPVDGLCEVIGYTSHFFSPVLL